MNDMIPVGEGLCALPQNNNMAGFIKNIFRTLNNENVKYLVVGGVAVVLHGAPRMTVDLDIMVDLERENILKLWKALEKLTYRPNVPVAAADFADPRKKNEWIDKKGMKVLQFIRLDRPFESVDVFVGDPIGFDGAYSRRKEIEAGDTIIPLISIDDLIYLKKEAARIKDLADIEALDELKKRKMSGE